MVTHRILFVCLGNICRSPMAEGVFRRVAEEEGLIDRFEIDSFRKDCLLKGLDAIDLTLGYEKDIASFETKQRQEMRWL